jgi:hypothetical protein
LPRPERPSTFRSGIDVVGDEQEQRLVDDLVADLLQDLVLRRRIERRARFSSNASIARVVLAGPMEGRR